MDQTRLYYKDPYQTDFTAVVTDCCEAKKGWEVVLSQSCFYPEGGGQPFDTGILSFGDTEVKVTEVHEKNDIVYHTVSAPIPVGTEVKGAIDWERRFDLMQQHSGEHILSGILHEMLGAENVGFHLTTENVYLDFDKPMDMTLLREAEMRANRFIWENHPVEVSFPDAEALHALSYRSKKELTGEVRIVRFPGADCCACCGTHVGRSGEVGQLKILSVQNYKGGVRVEIAAGKRALLTATRWMTEAQEIGRMLSVKPYEACAAVARLADELGAAKGRIAALENEVFSAKAAALAGKDDLLLFEEGLSPDGVRKLATMIIENRSGRVALFSGDDSTGYKYAVGEKDGDLRAFVKAMNTALTGRGGGKPFFAQGSVAADKAAIERFFESEGK